MSQRASHDGPRQGWPHGPRSASVRAQAKLNLWLRVLAREHDGYHSIETLFHRLELHDDVTVTLAPAGTRTVQCTANVGSPDRNLAYRAGEAYCSAAGWDTGFSITIVKRIPVGAGLGGGSADAAAALRALAALRPSDVREPDSLELAAAIGADVPFLAGNAVAALAWGRGTRMLRLVPRPARPVLLLVPDFCVGTADAYAWLDAAGQPHGSAGGVDGSRTASEPAILNVESLSAWPAEPQMASNDFVGAVDAMVGNGRIVASIRALLDAGAALAGMTGSGSTVFGVFDKNPDAGALADATGSRAIVTRSATAVEGAHCSD